ncbi:MAG: hypothetical protein JNG89_16500 [Planctomycetaceae bacterium]|nr:hypothetical protein [Planctomycetaceae bacterium]
MLRITRLVAVVLFIVSSSGSVLAGDELREWFTESYTGPEFGGSLEGSYHGLEIFSVGDMIFAYGYDSLPEEGTGDLAELESVKRTVERCTPDRATAALVDLMLDMPHAFHFEGASLKDQGDAGLLWQVSWTLFPREGGSSGVPYRYIALALPDGKLIAPRRALCDSYFVEPGAWYCSFLSLEEGVPGTEALDREEIVDRATAAVADAIAPTDEGDSECKSMEIGVVRERRMLIPLAESGPVDLLCREVWAIEFAGHDYEYSRPDEQNVFTVWVSAKGQVADVRRFPIEADDESPMAAP